ncbi:hypothetical protein MSG28_003139 [Choristoneura fumiferana]|uniref:Uncharacterized protein n=1 Tax=Choristoneura fumiferana TaxID=7141 RepID=A0ACC0KEG8_CHOFU|nr:hypothetical protein MSG28_003139 [Choristoneura fumiferana]
MDFVIGGLAGAGATVFTNPIDVVKTRMQLQGELQPKNQQVVRYKGMFHALYVIGRTDGALALQKGLAPALILGFTMNSVRLGMYHVAEVNGWTKKKGGDVSINKAMFWSSVSGILSGVVANPVSVLKTRIQASAHPSIAVGRQHRYKGETGRLTTSYSSQAYEWPIRGCAAARYDDATDWRVASERVHTCRVASESARGMLRGVAGVGTRPSMFDGMSKIYYSEGFKGYFAGVNATCTRLAVGSAAQLTTFSAAKEALAFHGIFESSPFWLAFAASAISGAVVALAMCPFDVTTVRLYNQGNVNYNLSVCTERKSS